jgi:hypothetical protein
MLRGLIWEVPMKLMKEVLTVVEKTYLLSHKKVCTNFFELYIAFPPVFRGNWKYFDDQGNYNWSNKTKGAFSSDLPQV